MAFVDKGSVEPIQMQDKKDVEFAIRLKVWKDLRIRIFIAIDKNAGAVIMIFRNYGYDKINEDPKVLYDTIYKVFTKTMNNLMPTFIREFINVDINKFESF